MKRLAILGSVMVGVALVLMLCVATMGVVVFAEDTTTTTYPCTIEYALEGYGDITCDIEGGNVGDVATLTIAPYVFCKLSNVKVNGVDLVANESGVYSFALIEGVNTISATFVFDEEQLGQLSGYLNQAQEEGLASLFTMENLMQLISWAISLLMGSGFLITWIKTKTIKSATSESVKNECISASKDTISSSLSDFLTTQLSPMLQTLSEKLNNTDEICQTLARCMVLAQENTPESRLAIIEELTKLKTSSVDLADAVKTLIANEVAKNQAQEEEKKVALEELEQANNSIQPVETTPIVVEEDKVVENY